MSLRTDKRNRRVLRPSTASRPSIAGRRLVAERLEDRNLLAVLFEQGPSDAVRVSVPTEVDYNDFGFDWTGAAEPFDDSTWSEVSGVPNGVGYDRGSGAYDSAIGLDIESTMYEDSTTLFARAEFGVEDATAVGKLTLQLRYDDGFIAWLNGAEVARANVVGSYPAWNARAAAEYEAPLTPVAFDLSAYVSHLRDGANVFAIRLLNDSPTGDDALLQFTLTGESREGPPLAVDDTAETPESQPVTIDVLANDREGSDPIDPTTVTIATPAQHGTAVVNPNGTITYTPSGIYNGPDSFTYTVRDSSESGGQPRMETLVAPNGAVRTFVPENNNYGTTWRGANEPFNDAGWPSGAYGVGYDTNTAGFDYNPFVSTNVRTAMLNVNTSIYLRSKFSITNPADVTSLTLRLRYDDGFAAFINGVQVASAFTPAGALTYNSRTINETTSGANGDQNAVVFQAFDLTPFLSSLTPGINVLAIHGLNQRLDSSDFLMQPELTAIVEPQGRLSNPAAVMIDVAAIDYSPIANADAYEIDEGETLVVGESSGSPDLVPGPGQVVWPTATGGNGHLYQAVRAAGGVTWRDAHDAARAAGGKLATITSAAENEFVYQLISDSQFWTTNNDYFGPWIGGFQSGLNGSGLTWNWLTGEPFTYTNWASGEPNGPSDQGQNIFYFSFDPGIPVPTWADRTWDTSSRPNSYVIEWDVAPNARSTLIAEGSTWRFQDNGVAPLPDSQGDSWKEHDYDDASWSSGLAELGYGDGDEATVINCGPTRPTCSQQNYVTTWFRRTFTVPLGDRENWQSLYLEFMRDDGVAVYINGIEVARSHLPGTLGDNAITPTTLAALTAGHADEFAFQPPVVLDLSLPAWSNLLHDGDNVVAVELHQDRTDSSDTSFDLQLAATLVRSTGLLANDIEPDAQEMTAIVVAGPSHGTLALESDGTFEYVPNQGFVGVDTFTYRASDGVLFSEPATVTISVNHLPPAASSDAYSTNEDTPLVVSAAIGVLINDTDSLDHALSAVLESPPSHGTLSFSANGAFVYTPDANYHGADSFTYRATDGTLNSVAATVSITVISIDDVPVATRDTYIVGQGETLSFAANWSYSLEVLDKDPLAYWRLDEIAGTSAFDFANNHHGTYVGNVGFSQPGAIEGDPNTSVDIDGSIGYVQVPGTAFQLANNFTITAWIRADTVTGLDRIVSNRGTVTDGYGFGLEGGNLWFTTYGRKDYSTSVAIQPGRWYHVAVVFDTSNRASFYRDGVLAQTVTGDLPAAPGGQFFTIGRQPFAGTSGFETFDGLIDEVAVYNRSLSSEEIRSQFDVGSGAGAEASLIAINSVWKYRDNIANGAAYPVDLQGDRWTENDYDDAAWPSGAAILGYGVIDGGPIATTLSFGGNASDKFRTALFRRAFEIDDAERVLSLSFSLLVDDGAAVYINGREVRRQFMAGTVGDNTITTSTFAQAGDEANYTSFTIDPAAFPGLLVDGTNTIAVEVHQLDATSSDLGLDLSLSASIRPDPAASGVLANDTDGDGDDLAAVLVSNPMHGALQFDGNGTFTYTPTEGFVGVDRFTYRATDGSLQSQPTTVTIVVKSPTTLPEDLNADGAINAGDVAFLMASYGKASGAKSIEGDFDADARIGVRDAIRLRNAFTPAPSPSAAAAIVARASDRAVVEMGSANLLRADRRVRRLSDSFYEVGPAATDHAFSAIVELSSSLTGRRSRLLVRTRG